MKNRLILRSFQSPGDIVMLTAAVRDLHAAHPGRFQTDVRTSADAIWENNPLVTELHEHDPEVASLDMHYPLIHHSNDRPYHFLHGFTQYLEQQLDLRIPVTKFRGDIHLSDAEKQAPPLAGLRSHARQSLGSPSREEKETPPFAGGLPDKFWIIVAGGKYDFTAKWWNPTSYQAVVDHFNGRIHFVQCGEQGHWHPRLQGTVDLVGKTSLREFIRLMYHAEGVLCPVTLAMHLAAAVESKPGRPRIRPCVVVAGGREPAHWEAYPNHQYISTNGMLACCAQGGCWKSRCQLVGDANDRKDVCELPVQITDELRIPKCMDMITPDEVIRRIELYHQGGLHRYLAEGGERRGESRIEPEHQGESLQCETNEKHKEDAKMTATETRPNAQPERTTKHPTSVDGKRRTTKQKISVSFYHGLGDCAYFAHLIPLYTKRGYEVEVECTPDKRAIFHAVGAKTIKSGAAQSDPWSYPSEETREGHGHFWQGSKMGHNISTPPLPNIGDKIGLWQEYCDTRIDIEPLLPEKAKQTAENWLSKLPRPIVLLHSKGNTAQERKSLPDAITAQFYKQFIDQCESTLVLLDWDHRVPRLASHRVRHLDDLGPCCLEVLLALIAHSDLIVGIDSGPLHVSRFTSTPALGIWMPGHYPTTYTLPRPEQMNVVLAEPTRRWNRFKRIPWNIVEHPGRTFEAERLASLCRQMLSPPRYLDQQHIAADVQLQQFVRTWCRGAGSNALSSYADRNRSFDILFREMARRFETPTVIETGVIRAEEDWAGAGFFTYLAGTYLHHSGGRLHAVDIASRHCDFARTWTNVFGPTVEVHQQDSVTFLHQFKGSIDVLYLDSLDTTEPNHAQHALQETKAALPKLHDQSLIVFDDTPWQSGKWIGKGADAVPFLLQKDWKILYAGYQVVLGRT